MSARSPRVPSPALAAAALTLVGCAAAPERLEVDPARLLDELDAVRLELQPADTPPGPESALAFDPADGLDADEAVAFALARHPALAARRAQLGVERALAVEAGLLPDPTFAWNAMDWVVGGTSDDVLTGFSLTLPLLRPGERDAARALGEARVAVELAALRRAEWELEHRVRLGWLELAAAQERIALQAHLRDVVAETAGFLERQREARAATGLEADLARLELIEIELVAAELARERAAARLELTRLLGLPPGATLELPAKALARGAASVPDAARSRDERLETCPDVALALAAWRASEEDVALAAARRMPHLYVGTAFGVVLPLFSRAGKPQLATALARRTQAAEQVRASLFEARAQLALAEKRHELARQRLDTGSAALEPALATVAARLGEARAARAVRVVELLAAQRRLVDARRALLEARVDLARSVVELAAAAGPAPAPDSPAPEPAP